MPVGSIPTVRTCATLSAEALWYSGDAEWPCQRHEPTQRERVRLDQSHAVDLRELAQRSAAGECACRDVSRRTWPRK